MTLAFWAAVIIAAATPTSAPNPFTVETPGPGMLNLPEIGRTRTRSASCVAIREVVVPAFKAAQTGDATFQAKMTPSLRKYAEAVGDKNLGAEVNRQRELHALGRSLVTLGERTEEIARALNDPRLSEKLNDPQIQQLRVGLSALYDAQQGRVAILDQFVQKEMVGNSKAELSDNGAFTSRARSATMAQQTLAQTSVAEDAQARRVDYPDLPHLSRIDPMIDGARMDEWSKQLRNAVHERENVAAKTFLKAGTGCR